MKTNKIIRYCCSVFAVLFMVLINSHNVSAKTLDEILSYVVTADVNDDATVNLQYDVSWKVLDSSSEGPLEWSKIGLPNKHVLSIEPLTSNIKRIEQTSSGGSYANIYFYDKYYAGDVVDFSYIVHMDYMYQANPDEGYVEYTFTPGWFDDIEVDNLVIRWNNEKVESWTNDCLIDGGYNTWSCHLKPGEKKTVTLRYPVDAYEFDLTKYADNGDDDDWDFSKHSLIANIFFVIAIIIFIIFTCVICFAPFVVPAIIIYAIYKGFSGFRLSAEKKITRTIIDYYPSCPNCGGSRAEGSDKCSYCGSNMIKSKHEIKEESPSDEYKEAFSYKEKGDYRLSSSPNRYVRVNIISVPHPTFVTRSSGGHHSSCAHSSCACACACACAGGGRAGCTTKDFYKTNMKLSYLLNKKHKK